VRALLLFFLLPTLALAQPQLATRLDAAVSPLFQANQPGGAVIVTQGGKVVYRKAFGMADLATDTPVRPDMPFRIGSITKQFTAVAVMMLADEGKLSLSDEVTRLVPEFAAGRGITIEHLLTHSSGLGNYNDRPQDAASMAADMSRKEILEAIADEPRRFAPGEAVAYSNSAFYLLGLVIESASGMRYADFLAERIFEPLGMRSTTYEGRERDGTRRVEGYVRGRGKPFQKALPISMTQTFSAGAVISTVDDLARWDAAVSAGKLLKPETWRRVFTPFTLRNGQATRNGIGWFLDRDTWGQDVYWHAGGINGFASLALRVPGADLYVAVLLNNSGETISAVHVAQTLLSAALTARSSAAPPPRS
jgi:CubicO group peptidase (beta-lactamase class C family)